jgi:N-acetylneuraminate synthase
VTHTFVIAECGSCHDNSFTKALRLIDAAKDCGADAAKFQYWSHPGKLAARRKLGPEAKAIYERYQLPKSWIPELKNYCDEAGIEFMCTAYLTEDIEVIEPYVKRFKVSAYESDWRQFVDAHFYRSKETIISSNHPDSYSIQMKLPGTARPAHLLYCVSEYPCPIERLKLWEMVEVADGLSDHTASTLTGALAVAGGAKIIEKHHRLGDTHPSNPDYPHSLITSDFMTYVQNIREAERAMG